MKTTFKAKILFESHSLSGYLEDSTDKPPFTWNRMQQIINRGRATIELVSNAYFTGSTEPTIIIKELK